MRDRLDSTGHSFQAYFKRATSPLVVLRLLMEKPMYGYELTQEMKQRSGGAFTISVLYPVLYRLEDAGLLTSEVLAPPGGRAKKYYRITDAGRRTLAQMQQFWQEYKRCIDDIMEV